MIGSLASIGVFLVLFALRWLGQEQVVPSWITSISDLGIVVFLVVVFFGGLREKPWWIPGSTHRSALVSEAQSRLAAERDRDFYRNALFRALGASERAVEATKVLAEHATVDTDAELLRKADEARRRGLIP